MKIDLNQMFTAFALNFPGKAKHREVDYHSPDDPWDFHNSHWGEIIIGDRLVQIQRIGTTGQHIFDVYHNDLLGNEEIIAIRSTLLDNEKGFLWEPSIPVVKRLFEVNNIAELIGANLERWVDEKNIISCQPIFRQNFSWGYYISDIGTYDFGGNIGLRAYLVLTSLYGIQENYAYDIGPDLNTFEPKYGLLAYKHWHNDDAWAIETYAWIEDFIYLEYSCPVLL